VPYLTRSEGERIAALRRARPAIPHWEAIKLARRYIGAADDHQELLALDRYLAAGLWEASTDLIIEAVEEGIITWEQLSLIDGADAFGTPVYRLRS
jgi:hypothetical protein